MTDNANVTTGNVETADLPRHSTATTASLFHTFPAVQVDMAALSDMGRVRTNNEDHFYAGRWGRFMEVAATNLPEGELPKRAEEVGYVLLVADGMGGEEGGEVASRLAIRTFIKQVMQLPEWFMRADSSGTEQPFVDRTVERYQRVDATLRQHAERHQALSRMGTTMTMAYSVGADLFLAHIGDSRAYLLRDGQLKQLTRDQTLAQLLVDRGELTPEQAASHRLRHVLTQVLGGQGEQLQVDIQQITLADDDWLLLCSDGLSDMVTDELLGKLIVDSKSADAACQALIDKALEQGGRDNVTAVLAHYRFPGAA